MRCAYSLIRPEPIYRADAFRKGLAGFKLPDGQPKGRPGDVLVVWNRYGANHETATQFETAGGTVVVAENGYLNAGGSSPHGDAERQVYALAIGSHNDDTAIRSSSPSRWAALGIELRPWRTDGRHILIAPNRSFGTPGRIQPLDWAERTRDTLRKYTKREIRIRAHPGNNAPTKPLADDLAGAWATIVWHSSAGVHSLIAGVPVICCGPKWIAKSAAGSRLNEIESPPIPDRLPAMQRLACGQFFLREIESGDAIRDLLRAAG